MAPKEKSPPTKNEILSLSSVMLESTFLRDSPAVRTPFIQTTNEKNEPQTIVLEYGKLVAIDSRFVEKINKELTTIDLYTLKDEVAKVQDLLDKQTEDELPRAPEEYIFKKQGLRAYLVYMLADVVRNGTKNREFDFDDKIPTLGLTRNILSKGKLINIEDYDQLTKYTVGYEENKKQSKPVFYVPDFPYLLKQVRWLNTVEGKSEDGSSPKTLTAKIDYNFLEIKKFSPQTNNVLKNFTPSEYSILMAVNNATFTTLRDTQNEKDFFDQLYTYKIYYKPQVVSSPNNPNPTQSKTALDAFKEPLTPAEKEKIMEELFYRRHKIVEQAFGGSGCVEFALKSVQSIEDLYENVMYKADWAFFIAQTIDRFKCELSKLGGGSLACLADYDVMGTYNSTLSAIETVENFEAFTKRELEVQPTFPVMKLIYDRKIPKLPSIDWYSCLRAFLIALVIKIAMDLITAFVQMILAMLDVQCDVDFSDCSKSNRDSDTSDLGTALNQATGNAVAAGLPPTPPVGFAEGLAAFTRNAQIGEQITTERIKQFLNFLGQKMPPSHVRSLLAEDTPIHIFSHGKLLANSFFAPIDFSDKQLRTMLNLIDSVYNYDALIGATLLSKTLPEPNCPPDLFGGEEIIDSIRDALKTKLQRERGIDSKTAQAQADIELNKVRGEVEEKVSAFCESLKFAGGVLNEINSAPSLLAGTTNEFVAGTITQIITQLRVKPFYDFSMLKYLFTGDIFGGNPTKDDLVRADLSLAYNVLYRNYWLSRVDTRSYFKNYELRPQGFKHSLGTRWGHTTDILEEDSFEKEFLQDLLKVIAVVNPFILPFYPALEMALFKASKPLNGFDRTLLGASRDLNNSNYFYAWAENLLALIPMLDPRRFGTKYEDFVKENYPNAANGKLLEPTFKLTSTFGSDGLQYTYTNGNITLLDMQIGLTDFLVSINNNRTQFKRDLPKLSEPFLVDETQDYMSIVKDYDDINTVTKTENPQKKIYNSLMEMGLTKRDLYGNTGFEVYVRDIIISTFDNSYERINKELQANLENADRKVAEFFFKPYMEASQIFGNLTEAQAKKKFEGKTDIKKLLEGMGNPRAPAARFFERSDNIFSDVYFEDSVTKEVDKVMHKVSASFKNFYKNMSDGLPYDPNAISQALSTSSNDSSAFYEAQKKATSKRPDWLSQRTLTPTAQKAILEAIKEVTS